MAFWTSFVNIIVEIILSLWNLFVIWSAVFFAPFKNFQVLWITIPIWLSWFFADYFQEKKGTSFGNAISNGIIPLWVGIDWTRFLVTQLSSKKLIFGWTVAVKFFICLVALTYGILIVYCAWQTKPYTRYLGRIREVTYVLLVFTPVIYGILSLSWTLMAAVLLYFPLYYFGIELLFYVLPNPRALEEDES